MPPSGFNIKQSNKISDFLSLCLEDLILESKKYKLSFIDTLEKEITNIDTINELKKSDVFQYHLLVIIRMYYTELLKTNPVSEKEIRDEGKRISMRFNQKILEIHVPKIKNN